MSNILDPMTLLQMRAQNSPSAAAPTGGAPPPAAAGAPAAVPPSGGGGMFSNIGTRLGQAMSGQRGLFAGAPDAAADAAIDPVTGAPAGVMRQATNQSIMKMGLMLIAAGQRQSDDSRAQILAGLGGAADTSDTLNNFARNRLEMAKIKLLERDQASQLALRSTLGGMFGAGDTPAASPSPVAGGAADPAALAAPVTAAPGTAPTTPVQRAPLAPLDAPSARVSGAFDATAGSGLEPAPAPTTPGTAPTGIAVAGSALPTKAPPAPVMPANDALTPEEKKMGALLLSTDPTGKTALEFVKDRQMKRADAEISGEPYLSNGMIVQDVYRGGRKVDTKRLGDAQANVVISKGANGETIVQKQLPDGTATDFDIIRDPVADEKAKRADKRANPDLPEGMMVDPKNPSGVVPIPGSKQEREMATAAEKKANLDAMNERYATGVRAEIDRALDLSTTTQDNILPASGGIRAAGAALIPGTNASTLEGTLETIKANLGLTRLQEMRNSNPTGAALGDVTQSEAKRLDDTYGKLSIAGNRDVFEYRLAQIRNQMDDIAYGVGKGPERIPLETLPGHSNASAEDRLSRLQRKETPAADAAPSSNGKEGRAVPPAPAGIDPAEWAVMTPEERALFK